MSQKRIRLLKILSPFFVLAVGAVVSVGMVRLKPEVQTRPSEKKPPLVRARQVLLQDLHLSVTSQGTVSPRTESQLVPEVTGRVIWVSPSFASGGFFEEGEVLLRIDPYDYRQTVIRARAEVARAKLLLAQEEAEARVARREWGDLGRGQADPLTLREPQLEEARAALAAAEAGLDRAERDLERTEVRAPYAGRVREKNVDVGQFVSVGSPVARLYSVDYAEVRLPLPNDELAFIDLPLDYRGDRQKAPGPRVTLRADFAGRSYEWEGRLVRTEGEIDPQSRMVHAVAQVKDPYAKGSDPDRPPLAVGMFVQAEIEGREVRNVAVLPRSVLRGRDELTVIDPENRLRFRQVEVLRLTDEEVVISGGIESNERVCLSNLEAVTDGTEIRTVDESTVDGAATEGGLS